MTGAHRVKFEARHYRYMGVPHGNGLPILEAHILVNQMNSTNRKYKYWLEEAQ